MTFRPSCQPSSITGTSSELLEKTGENIIVTTREESENRSIVIFCKFEYNLISVTYNLVDVDIVSYVRL